MSELNRDIKYIKGIGEKRAQLFKKRLGLFTLNDLITFYPRSYEDWSSPYKISDVPLGENVCIKAKIATDIEKKESYNKKITTFTFYIYDRTGQIKVVIFGNKYLAESLKKNKVYLFYGKVKWNGIYREINSPEIREENETKIFPIYHATEGLTSRTIARVMYNALSLLDDEDFLPNYVVSKFDIITHFEAVKQIHFPDSNEMLEKAIKRLSFEELFLLRLGFYGIKKRNRGYNAKILKPLDENEYSSIFPFQLTNAQKRVINECLSDMAKSTPMNRLVQGDVGSGKTAVAAALMYTVYKNTFMSVMLAPTEILAMQHFNTLKDLFKDKNINIELLIGSLSVKKKKALKSDIKNGKIDILIATHAVLNDDVELPNSALIITDEQHRFGVAQRAVLSQKAVSPHTLVMSATPIPRTMGLTVYGDLDISIINETPKGRQKIKSYYIDDTIRTRALNYVKKHLDEGYQGYIVCPMIEEDEEKNDFGIKTAVSYAEELKNGIFKEYSVGLLHGKMKPAEKESVMKDFKLGKINLLVATTVVEVGVDVPNAVIMIIENAERFGLSQLHQLRGRIGRGTAASTCIFISSSKSESAKERLKTVCSTSDGFIIAEADLKQRGPGNFLGKEQHGLPKLKIADMLNDTDILRAAGKAVDMIIEKDPYLNNPENLLLKKEVNTLFSIKNHIEFN